MISPKLREKGLAYLLIQTPKYAFVYYSASYTAKNINKDTDKSFTRGDKRTMDSRFSLGYQSIKLLSRVRKKNIKAKRFIDDGISRNAMVGLGDEVVTRIELR